MRILQFLLFLLLVASCDPVYDVDYIIHNETSGLLSIYSTNYYELNQVDTNIISSNTKLILLNQSGLGLFNKKYINDRDSINVFAKLEMLNSAGKKYNKDVFDIINWHKFNNDSEASIDLIVRDEDFK